MTNGRCASSYMTIRWMQWLGFYGVALLIPMFCSCAVLMDTAMEEPHRIVVPPIVGEEKQLPVKVAQDFNFQSHPHRSATAAILTFDARAGFSNEEVALLADRFAVEIGRAGVYKLISRSKMNEVLEEQKFSVECSSAECAVEAGRILSAEYMIYGSIGKIGSMFTINVYVTSVETGVVVCEATVDYTGQIENLLTDGMTRAAFSLLRAGSS